MGELLNNLFFGHGVSSAVLSLSLAVAFGILIGKIGFRGVSMGLAGVLFSGLILGHFGLSIEKETLEFVREFGLMLFVYSIGIQIGPAFFASFMKQGLKLNIVAALVVASGFLIACGMVIFLGIPLPAAVGIMSGAVTNTPGLGAAQQALIDASPDAQDLVQTTGMAYAMCYPLGIAGIISVILGLKRIFKIDISAEQKHFESLQNEYLAKPSAFNIIVSNKKLAGTSIAELHLLVKQKFMISRLFRNGILSTPDSSEKLEIGDIIHVLCSKEAADDISLLAGDISELDLKQIGGSLISKTAVVTSKKCINRPIAELRLHGKYSVNISRVNRAGMDLIAAQGLKLQFGDTVTLVGEKDNIESAAKEFGDSIKVLEHPNILPLFIGLILGIFLGSIPISIPGFQIPLKLGLSGGALLSAMLFSRIGQIGALSWYMPQSANLVLREFGISLFLACVGLRAGGKFFQTLASLEGLVWILLGVVVTVVPIFIAGLICRKFFAFNYLTLCGLLSGSMTDPPALSFANQAFKSDAPSITYATVYAMTMFLRIMFAQLLVILFFRS